MAFRRQIIFSLMFVFAVGMGVGFGASSVVAALMGSAVFRDVQPGSFADQAIGEMYADGIIKGYDDGLFHPNDPVTRAQLAVIFQRFRGGGTAPVTVRSSSKRSSSSRTAEGQTSSSTSIAERPLNTNGSFRFTTTNFTVSETATTATVSVVRIGGKQGAVTVKYSLVPDTAKAGTDYTETSGTLTFANNESSKMFQVVVNNTTTTEGTRKLKVVLADPTGGADLGDPKEATVTITDDETVAASSAAPTTTTNPATTFEFSALTYSVYERSGTITITIKRLGNTSAAGSVRFTTADGTAVSGRDYSQNSGTIDFAPGDSSKTFTVQVTDNTSIDGNLTVNLRLSNPVGAVLGVNANVVLIIIDDEAMTAGTGSIRFAQASYLVTKSVGNATLTVQRLGGARGVVRVNYATTDGLAKAGADYTAMSGTLEFLDGETAKTILVPITDDTRIKPDMSFTMSLSGLTGGATMGDYPGTAVTILGTGGN